MSRKPKTADSEGQWIQLQKKLHTDSLTYDDLDQLCTIILGTNWSENCSNKSFNQRFENTLISWGFAEPISYSIFPQKDIFLEKKEMRKPALITNPRRGTHIYTAERNTYEGRLSLLYLLLNSYGKRPTRSPTKTKVEVCIWDSTENEKLTLETEGPLYHNLCKLYSYILKNKDI